MNATLASPSFELTGRFGGFVFTAAGKRRMLLRCREEGDRLLKVPKDLRRRIVGKFQPGETMRVAGTEERNPVTGSVKLIVVKVLPNVAGVVVPDRTAGASTLPPPPVATCPVVIRVCAKKHCWRNGGRELWEALGRELDAGGLSGQIKLRQVNCLDRCKHAPNADRDHHEYSRCSPGDACAIIAHAAGSPAPRETDG